MKARLDPPLRVFSVDRLEVRVYPDRRALGAAAAADCARAMREVLSARPRCRMVFAAAPSQNEVLSGLREAEGIDWPRVEAFHMDEYPGLPAGDSRRFGFFLREALFSRVPLGRVEYLAPVPVLAGPDLRREADRYAALLSEAPVDLVCLGVGENGHIAFNDPGVADFSDPRTVKEAELDPACRAQQVHDACFSSLDEVPRIALTLTVPALLSGGRLFCAVPGPAKARAVNRMLTGPVSPDCPASALRRHPACVLYLDTDSAGALP